MRRPWSVIPLLVALGLTSARADWKDDVGFTRLNQTFTSGVPDNLTAGVTQVEAGYTASAYYLPDTADLQFTGKTFTDKSTTKVAGASWHATNVGSFFYGSTSSLIPATTTIDIFSALDWINSIPLTESRKVQNHSWIIDTLTSNIGATVTTFNKRIDSMVTASGYVCVVGVNNGSTSSTILPQLLCQSYNTLSVGLSNGNHSAGFTAYDGTGRIKPEIVAPDPNYTSFATAKVSSAAGLLTQKITAAPYSLSGVNIPLAVKALLLAGATKEEFPSWARTTARPLDLRYGAGELNTLLAYQTLLAGKFTASSNSVVAAAGWAVTTSSGLQNYFFDIPAGTASPRLSAALIWNRIVNSNFTTTTLANLELKLYNVTQGTFTLGTLADSSVSTVDNLEHIYQPSLAPGRYALQVTLTSGSNTPYALAWRTSSTVTVATTAVAARELDGTPGQFTVTRTGPTTTPLYVPLTLGGTAVSGTHYASLPAGALIPAGSASTTVQVVPVADALTQGDRTVTLSVATDFSLSAGTAATASVTVADKPYDAWRFSKFTTPQLANAVVSAPSADPDADGIPNLLEYAFAREPLTADSSAALPAVAIGLDGRLTLTFFQAASRPDLVFTPEWTSDLTGTWQSSATYLTEISRTAAVGGEDVTVRAEATLTVAPAQFLRLRVTRP